MTKEVWTSAQPVGVAFAGLLIFAADSLTVADGLASAFYILILLCLAESRPVLEVFVGAILCVFLTFATYPVAHGLHLHLCPLFRREISAAAILIALPVIRHNILLRGELTTLDMFLEMTNHPIIIRNRQERITFWNGAAQRLYGWTPREALGRNFFTLTGREPPGGGTGGLNKIAARAKNGNALMLLCRSLVGKDARGRENSLEIATDITSLEQGNAWLRESEARHRTIFNMVAAGLLELDAAPLLKLLMARGIRHGLAFRQLCGRDPALRLDFARALRPLDANDSAARILAARDKAEFLSKADLMLRLMPAEAFTTFVAALLDGADAWHGETETSSFRGDRRSLLVCAKFFHGEQSGRVLVSLVDETGRRRIQRAIADARHALLHVNHVTALGEMTAIIAHEVNHPLAAVIANAEAALRWLNRAAPDRRETLEAVGQIARNAGAANEIIANIQANNAGVTSHFYLEDIIASVCRLLQHELTRHNITLRREMAEPSLSLLGDRVEIEQVMVNLLANAIDAVAGTAAPGEILIRAERFGAHMLRVQIQDSGPGLQGLEPAQLFEPLYTTKTEGTGLGLPICRAIIHRHGGDLSLCDARPGGAVATFSVPMASPAPTPALARTARACGSRV